MPNRTSKNQTGISLVELMIAVALGLLILVGLITVFAHNSRTRDEIEKTSRQIENGRYAVQLLGDDLQAAGFLDTLPAAPAAPAALPDPCATDLATLQSAMGLHVQGYDNNSGGLSCLSDIKAGTDVVVVRRTSSCRSVNPADANCDGVIAGATYFQVSGCSTDTAPAGQTTPPYYLLDTNTANLTLKKIGCTNGVASLRRYLTHIYFIANNDVAGDGIPTLKRWELGTGIVPLVEGIDNLQLEYGVDSSGDGIPDAYTAAPATVADWSNVTSIKLHILARNTASTLGYSDTKTYALGLNADGSANNVGPFNDAYKRHAYTTATRLDNPAGRRE